MGRKTAARTRMRDAGVPIIPGTTEPVASAEEIARLGDEIGYPMIVKAAAGGGGKGMRIVRSPDEAERAFESASREGQAYFADPSVYVERYLENPRHVEVQVLADAHGNVIHLGERDCTIQRRHQKLDRGDALARGRRRSCANGSARSPSTPRELSATARPGRSKVCSRPTAPTTSWR